MYAHNKYLTELADEFEYFAMCIVQYKCLNGLLFRCFSFVVETRHMSVYVIQKNNDYVICETSNTQ